MSTQFPLSALIHTGPITCQGTGVLAVQSVAGRMVSLVTIYVMFHLQFYYNLHGISWEVSKILGDLG